MAKLSIPFDRYLVVRAADIVTGDVIRGVYGPNATVATAHRPGQTCTDFRLASHRVGHEYRATIDGTGAVKPYGDHPVADDALILITRAPAPPTACEPSRWRLARCEGCGDEIEIDQDGYRTLCGCDVAE